MAFSSFRSRSHNHSQDLLSVELSVNGKVNLASIQKEMIHMFDDVAASYKSKVNRAETDIKFAVKKANELIYREARMKAPRIRPEIYARESKETQPIHLSDKRYMVERQAGGRVWRAQGIVGRRVITFKSPVSQYVAAVEYGRDEFVQVMKKKPFGIQGGDTDFWLRSVGAAKAQPFLRKAQNRKAQEAYDKFSTVLSGRWVKTMQRVARRKLKESKAMK